MLSEKIGRYEIIREIGRGGMAVVYLARDPLIDREVAVKVLPPQFTFDPQFRARFQQEAKVIAALEHPAIVPIYDFGEHDGQPFLVMRYMVGGNLAGRLAEGALPYEEARRIIDRLAPALDKAHSQGIIHRDLKPGNILFDQDDNPYVCDFGIAKLTEATATFTGSGIIGTPAYMSPEQARGEPGLDGRSDQYALGVILFQMLTGELPYEADSPMGQVMKHLTEPVPDILTFKEDLPTGCQGVIYQAMAKPKFERYENLAQMASALRAALRGEAITLASTAGQTLVPGSQDRTRFRMRGPGHGEEVGKWPRGPDTPPPPGTRRRWTGWVLAAGLMIAILAIFGYFFRNGFLGGVGLAQQPTATNPSPSPTPTRTSQPTTAATIAQGAPPAATPTATPSPPPTMTPTITVTPTPSGPVIGGADKLAFVSSGDVWIVNLDGSDLKQLTTSGGAKLNLNWTPDGQSITYVIGRCVQSVNIQSGQVLNILCVNWADSLSAFEISPDGSQVALSLSEGFYILPYDLESLAQIRTQTQLLNAERCTRYTERLTKGVRWSRDGKSLAAVAVVSEQGRQVDLIKVFDISRCGQSPVQVDEFPGTRFTIPGYLNSPQIVDFAWDGVSLFALAISKRNDFGDIYTYNLITNREQQVKPLDNLCCFRAFRWSPDGDYFLFAFHDIRYPGGSLMYYDIFGALEEAQHQPISLPEDLLSEKDENPQPALRPAP